MADESNISKSRADRAGAALAKAEDPDSGEFALHAAVIDEWRALHGAPLIWVAESVQTRARSVTSKVAVGQRLKRKPQIVAKLRREKTRLAQMQDIGGCRAILESPGQVDAVRDRIKNIQRGRYYDLKAEADYRAYGRHDTGYRALHLVVVRDDRQIEIQLRTIRQQAWAEAVERAANRSGFDLKSGSGPDEMIEFFRLASDGLHAIDQGKAPQPALIRKLKALRPRMEGHLVPVDRASRKPPANIRRQAFRHRLNNWLIVYDWRAARFVGWSDLGSNTAVAAERYASFEQRFQYEDGYEVVLIGADSTDTIKRTHAHYFGKDPNDFDPLGYFDELLSGSRR